MFTFTLEHRNIREVLMDRKLAALGDAYVNFVYSLALSKMKGKPVGAKVESSLLAEAMRQAGLRSLLPSRMDRHRQADAAEALVVYAWARGVMSIEEGVNILGKSEDMVKAFCSLLLTARRKLDL